MNHSETLTRIVRHLTLNYNSVPSPGLLNGKMGGVLFFYLYAKHSGQPHYRNIAESLLEGVYDQISENTPVDFLSGLCGIGWGVEYLIRNKFVDADPDDILEDIDIKLMESNVRRMNDWNFYSGLSGMLYYVVTRLESYDRQGKKMPFDAIYLQDFLKATGNYVPDTGSPFCDTLICRFQKIMNGEADYHTAIAIPEILYGSANTAPPTNLSALPLGILNGLTGTALKLILA